MSTQASVIGKDIKPTYPAGVNWDVNLPPRTLVEMVDEAVAKYGDKPAVNFQGKQTSYKELGELIDKAAKGFQDMGVKPGDKVGLFMPNTTFHFVMFFGALKAGATAVPFNSTYSTEELKTQIEDSGTEIMVTVPLQKGDSAFYSKVEELLVKGEVSKDFKVINCPLTEILPFPLKQLYPLVKKKEISPVADSIKDQVIPFKDFMDNDGAYKKVDVNPQDLAVLQYTGGTTGRSKGAMLTHFNIAANVMQTSEYMVSKDSNADGNVYVQPGQEKIMGILPFFHVYGLNTLMMFALNAGAEVVVVPNPRDIEGIAKTINKEKPTMAPFVPRHFRAILDAEGKRNEKPYAFASVKNFLKAIKKPDSSRFSKKRDFSSIKFYMSGGAALAVDLKTEFEKATNRPILSGYGLSETSPIVSSHSAGAKSPVESVGFIYPGTEVKIIPAAEPGENPSSWEALPMGEAGEICIRGPQVMQGYWKNPEANAKVFTPDGWLRTGDIGKVDANGQLYITDRAKDMGTINGENVYSVPVEEQILAHQDIAEVNVVFVPDARSGQAAVAFVRYNPGKTPADESALRTFFDESDMPKLNKPKHIIFWPEDQELPKTGVGKPDKKVMRELAVQQLNLNNGPKNSGPTPGI